MTRVVSNTFSLTVNDPNVLPAWVPSQGTFADLGTSTLASVTPTGWPTSDAGGPFSLWSSAVFAEDFSTHGGYVVHGSGHAETATPTFAGVWVYDLDDLTWKGRNVPGAVVGDGGVSGSIGTMFNAYGESLQTGSEGHTYPPHTYNGLIYVPATPSGNANGSLIRGGMGGSPYGSPMHEFDLSSASAAPTRVRDQFTTPDANGSYPSGTYDASREIIWASDGVGAHFRKISVSDWSIALQGVGFVQCNGNMCLIYVPAPYDCIVGLGWRLGYNNVLTAWVGAISGDAVSSISIITPTGTAPTDTRTGGTWSTLLESIVCYEGGGSSTVYKLTPPSDPANLLVTNAWAWSSETLTGVSGATPSQGIYANGSWRKMQEAPSVRCMIWCDSINDVPQAWRLTGM